MNTISIITATYNSARTVADCVISVRDQSVNAQHLIVDGLSSDNTLDVVKDLDPTATIVCESDDGIYDAMNKGIERSDGDIIGILNSDDFYAHTEVLSQVLKVFQNPDVDACYGDLVYVDERDTRKIVRRWRSGAYKKSKFYWGWMPPHPTFFVRRSVYQKYGFFDLSQGSAADYEIMLRFLVKHNLGAEYIPDTLVHMRTGGASNASIKSRLKANLMDRRAWKVNDLSPYPWTLHMKPLSKIGQFFV